MKKLVGFLSIIVILSGLITINILYNSNKIEEDNSIAFYDTKTKEETESIIKDQNEVITEPTTEVVTEPITEVIEEPTTIVVTQPIVVKNVELVFYNPYNEIVFETNISDTIKNKVISNYELLPNNVRTKFRELDWKIIVVSNNLNERMGYKYSILALTRYQEKVIYIDNRIQAADAIFHEMGHFVSYVNDRAHYNDEFETIFNEEQPIFKNVTNALEQNINSLPEYFAESYEIYLRNSSILKDNCPKTYAYLDYYSNIL